jgi:hypothetical protein
MDEYGTSSMHFDPVKNTLSLFGIAAREENTDSLLFMTDDGRSRKYIFRQLHDFLSEF